MTLFAALLVGFVTGARTFAPVALVAWAAAFGWLDMAGTWLGWLGAPAPAAVLTLLAFGELYGDKQPDCPDRTDWYALSGRVVIGAVAGAAIALGAETVQPGWLGALAGAAGALVGTFATFRLRRALTARIGGNVPAALTEDAIVIGGAVLGILLAA